MFDAAARAAKRGLDVVGAAAGLVATAPVLAVAAVAIRVTMGAPVVFKHQRPGLRGRPFMIFKLRTMAVDKAAEGDPTRDAQRLTTVGRVLRDLSLDELPQLLNVLRGDMSLVGPRPLMMQYLARYSPEQARRHDVKPGITGWAQVNGRNAIAWEEKFKFDVWYVDHWSLLLDLKILALTAARVLRKDGISSGGHVTMPEFVGSEPSGYSGSSPASLRSRPAP